MPRIGFFRRLRAAGSRRRWSEVKPGIDWLESRAMLSAAPITARWFTANLHDRAIEQRALQDWTKHAHTLTRLDMIGIFRGVAASGRLKATEFADLRTLVGNASRLKMNDSVRVLSSNIINPNVANRWYQGSPLLANGALSVGTTRGQIAALVDKWFLGKDHPDLGVLRAKAPGGVVTYAWAAGSLFGPRGIPCANDVAQGYLADCYFLSCLGITAQQTPQRIKSMIADNGDGTFTVRFYHGQTADYVTVDRSLPVDSIGWLVAADFRSAAVDSRNILWVPLIEKAYAQLSEEGWSRAYALSYDAAATSNSYESLSFGEDVPSLQQITGLPAADCAVPAPTLAAAASAPLEASLVSAIQSQQLVVAYTTGRTVVRKDMVRSHVYMVCAYDLLTHLIQVVNPLNDGVLQPCDGARILNLSFAEFASNFAGFSYVTNA